MAMNGVQLGDEIIAAIQSVTGGAPSAQVTAIWEAIGVAIVAHIQANAHATGTDSGNDSHNLTIQ